ncbi:MAG TPA: NADPH-dependent FMN reductase [Hyphomicrobiaceae bacterium]|nr:NADPH-dependent FMN reductase [Hyphomicrobiaceae bacterium]
MQKFKVAVIVGSNRRDSINRKLAEALAKLGEAKLDFVFVKIDDLPLYNQDLEADLPASVLRFKREIASADGLLFVTPEHNRSVPTALKNAVDWGARPWGQNSWVGKPVAITGTSPGALGAALAQQHLRQILGASLGALVMGGEAYVSFKPGLVTEKGEITDDSLRGFLQGFVDQVAAFVARFATSAPRSAAA